jgi:hypothetical protein
MTRAVFAMFALGCSHPRHPPVHDPRDVQMSAVVPEVRRCAAAIGFDGYLPVSITLRDDGTVAKVDATRSFEDFADPAVIACVERVVATLQFDASPHGSVFSYPFDLTRP